MKILASDLKAGLDLFQIKLNQTYPYVVPNTAELTFINFTKNKDPVRATLEYVRLVESGTAIFQVYEDIATDSLIVKISYAQLSKALNVYKSLSAARLFDDRRTTKEIQCVDTDNAKEIMAVVLVLCKFGIYGGYSYDYSTKRLTVF